MSIICEFCNKSFKSVYYLNTHKTTTKKCIQLQEEKTNKNIDSKRIN